MDIKDKAFENIEEGLQCRELDLEDIDRIYELDEDHSKCRDLEALSLESISRIKAFINLRKIESCEYSITTLFMWKKMYKPHLYFNENYMIIFEHYEGECYTLMPMCQPEYFVESFEKTVELFEEIGEVFEMYCVDEAYAKVIEAHFGDRFHVEADRSLADYLYDGESLRTLKGKKLRKKKNHINAFLRDYEGRFVFELLTSKDKVEVMEFLKEW